MWRPESSLMYPPNPNSTNDIMIYHDPDLQPHGPPSVLMFNNSHEPFSSVELFANLDMAALSIQCDQLEVGISDVFLVGGHRGTMGEGGCQPFCGHMEPCQHVDQVEENYYHVICNCPFGQCNKIALYFSKFKFEYQQVWFNYVKVFSQQLHPN